MGTHEALCRASDTSVVTNTHRCKDLGKRLQKQSRCGPGLPGSIKAL